MIVLSLSWFPVYKFLKNTAVSLISCDVGNSGFWSIRPASNALMIDLFRRYLVSLGAVQAMVIPNLANELDHSEVVDLWIVWLITLVLSSSSPILKPLCSRTNFQWTKYRQWTETSSLSVPLLVCAWPQAWIVRTEGIEPVRFGNFTTNFCWDLDDTIRNDAINGIGEHHLLLRRKGIHLDVCRPVIAIIIRALHCITLTST